MMDVVKPQSSSIHTAKKAGPDKRILRKLWKNVILTEAQLQLISRLMKLNLGLADIEEFLLTQKGKLKSCKFKTNNVNSNEVNVLMKKKLADAQERHREALKAKESKRNELDSLFGLRSRRCRNVMRKLGREMRILRSKLSIKNKAKVEWLQQKYREDSSIDNFVLPEDVSKYKGVKILSPNFVVPYRQK